LRRSIWVSCRNWLKVTRATIEFHHQMNVWIAADAAKHPTPPTESIESRFQAAMLRDIPFAVYCSLCLELILPYPSRESYWASSMLTPYHCPEDTAARRRRFSRNFSKGWRAAMTPKNNFALRTTTREPRGQAVLEWWNCTGAPAKAADADWNPELFEKEPEALRQMFARS
jgi:hypothetical protein